MKYKKERIIIVKCPLSSEDLREMPFLRKICFFKKHDIKDAIAKVEKNQDIENTTGVWALFGKKEDCDEWVCLEVGSSKDIKKEIIGDLKLMISKIEIMSKSSAFHKNVFEALAYVDRQSFKYRKIYETYDDFYWSEIDIEKYICGKDSNKYDKINFTEVSFAYETQALFWNPAPATDKNREKEILNWIKGRDGKRE
ncbi:MAG: hypothetical protein K2L82_16645 [Lachnospiraceae bacterium]|nr:hypothetical protein [Lachnospiraceae bacterium]